MMNDRDSEEQSAEPYRGEYEGRLTTFLWPVTSWIMTNLVMGPFVVLFFWVLNRTRVYGRSRVPLEPNTLLISNHQSMIDSFAIGYSAFFPRNVFRPFLAPWNPAAQENFFKNKFLAWVFHQFKCIPVRPGRRDVKALNRSIRALRDSTMVLFPEGTRSRDGSIGRGRAGAGMVISGTQPNVVPVTIEGMDRVLPIGAKLPRIGQRISIYFGDPIDYADFEDAPRNRENAQLIVDRVMNRVRFQRRVLDRLQRR